jgi:hypothetical protein
MPRPSLYTIYLKYKNVDRSTSSHDSKKFRTKSMEKQEGMAFGSKKTGTAVLQQGR